MTRALVLSSRVCLGLALVVPAVTPAHVEAAPAEGRTLTWPRPDLPRLAPCGEAKARPRSGRGLLIAGGVITGLGLIPLSTGIWTRVKYGPCGGGLCVDGLGQMAAGGIMVGVGAILLIVGGVRYHRYQQSQARLAPHVERTPHGGTVAGLQLSF